MRLADPGNSLEARHIRRETGHRDTVFVPSDNVEQRLANLRLRPGIAGNQRVCARANAMSSVT